MYIYLTFYFDVVVQRLALNTRVVSSSFARVIIKTPLARTSTHKIHFPEETHSSCFWFLLSKESRMLFCLHLDMHLIVSHESNLVSA